MKITNIGSKIVNIGAAAIMPGDTAEVDDSFKGNGSLDMFAKMGFISIGKATSASAAIAAATAAKAAAEKKAKEEAAAKAAAKAAEESAKNGSK